jgi:superfamily I DNA/RNA helicase
MITLTKEGLDIFEAAKSGTNILVQAVAGAGKSTVAAHICRHDQKATHYIVYTNANKNAMQRRVAGSPTRVSTIHSLGASVLSALLGSSFKPSPDAHLYTLKKSGVPRSWSGTQLAWDWLRTTFPTQSGGELEETLDTLIDCGEATEDLITLKGSLVKLYEKSLRMIRNDGRGDFIDLLWAPLHLNGSALTTKRLVDSLATFDRLILDEAQDISPLTLEFLKLLPSRIQKIGLGDRFQECFGFAGSYPDNMGDLGKFWKAQSLPLTTCFRCPDEVLEVVQQLVPSIRGTGKKGTVKFGVAESLQLPDFDLIVSARYTALAPIYVGCLVDRVPCRYLARNPLLEVERLLRKTGKEGNLETAVEFAMDDCTDRVKKLPRTKVNDEKRAKLQDQISLLSIIPLYFRDLEEIQRLSMVDPREGKGPILSSIHMAKGLEADRVAFLDSEGTEDWQKAAAGDHYDYALKLAYIALTRTKRSLTVVG